MTLFHRRPKERKPRTVGVFRENFELIAETLVFVFFILTFLFQSFVIPSSSMEDTLLIGDHLLVDKVAYSRSLGGLERLLLPQTPLARGMIVTFKPPPNPYDPGTDVSLLPAYRDWVLDENGSDKVPYPPASTDYVKRVVGLPGETIRIEDKRVYINGELLAEPYTFFKIGDASRDRTAVFPPDNELYWSPTFPHRFRSSLEKTQRGGAFRIPEGHYFCMGDNRDNSLDCRFWGPVPADYVVGKPWRIYWSYDADYQKTGIDRKLRDLSRTVLHFFSKTRWKRTIRKIY
jgi:signal peptidase I